MHAARRHYFIFVPGNFRSLELSFSTSKLAWNFRSLTLIIRPILYIIFDAFFKLQLSLVRPSIRNGCVVDKRWVIEENFLRG